MKTFAEANEAIAKAIASPNKSPIYTLDRIEKLLDALDNPQEKFKTIHIAGTSGKTSTAYYAAGMLQTAGLKTGLTVSPHINEMNERLQVDLQPLPETEFCTQLDEFIGILNELSIEPTYFELFISFAYWYFAKTGVEYVVVETGLGGLLDATNVIKRPDKICIITDIGLDHTEVLGSNLSEIAFQKAGIIHQGNQIFMRKQVDEVNKVVNEKAKENKAEIHYIEDAIDKVVEDLPNFQKRNWALAKAACQYALERENKQLNQEQWRKTARITVPGRMEIIEVHGKTLVLDGAHNTQKIHTFIKSYKAKFAARPTAVLLAVGQGRSAHLPSLAKEIEKISDNIIISTFGVIQDIRRNSFDATEVAGYFSGTVLIEKDLESAVAGLLEQKEDILLITGSLYLISEVKKILKKLLKQQ